MTETFVQALCVDCDGLHEFWRYDEGDQPLYEAAHDYPVYPRCIFEASLLGDGPEPIRPLDEYECDHCGGALREVAR